MASYSIALALALAVALALALVLAVAPVVEAASASNRPVDWVNTLGGTDSRYDYSHGSTLPLIGRPWGFNAWAPQTDNDPTWSGWWFHPSDRRLFGLRVTHQPSPWINDYGYFLLTPSLADIKHFNSSGQFSGYSPTASVFAPYLFRTSLIAYGDAEHLTHLEFTAASHGAVMRVHFPPFDEGAQYHQTRRIALSLFGSADVTEVSTTLYGDGDGVVTISGQSNANHGGVPEGFNHYFVAAIFGGPEGDRPVRSSHHFDGSSWAYVDFAPENPLHETLTVRVATSFISVAQALANLKQEVGPERSFASLVDEAYDEWNTLLSRVNVEEVGAKHHESASLLTTFYSSLYRASIFPRSLGEIDADTQQLVHWSPYDGKVHSGPLSTDSGFWDAYITVYPLQSLINPTRLGGMIQGWINAFTEGEWLPKWASPGYRGSMVGTMGDVTLADAIVKGIPGFDVDQAYAAIRKDAFQEPPVGVEGVGRVCLEAYLRHGYIPRAAFSTSGGVCSQVVSRTMNYYQSDFAIAQAAATLGHTDDAATLLARAMNYPAIFDKETLFFRSRNALTGNFTLPFDQFSWGGDYTEAGAYQYKFYVPFDPQGLAELYSAAGADMCAELERVQTMSSTFHIGFYSSEIHEQTEMALGCWGQYEHNNQPVHHMLYMFGAIDPKGYVGSCAARGQYYIRKALSELYRPGSDMFTGDEDNGEMASWYVLSALGLFNLSPGSTDYVFGSPLFEKVVVQLSDNGTTLTITSENAGPDNVYVQSVAWNGQVLTGTNSIAYAQLMQGGTLSFVMGSEPVASV